MRVFGPNERLPCPDFSLLPCSELSHRPPYRITGVRGRVPLEFYAVNVQNRHIGPGRRAPARCGVRSRAHVTLRDELYASIRSCALIYYPCNRGSLSLFPGRAAVSRLGERKREKEREKKRRKSVLRDGYGRGRGVMGRADRARGKIANLLAARPPRRNPYVRAARVLFSARLPLLLLLLLLSSSSSLARSRR